MAVFWRNGQFLFGMFDRLLSSPCLTHTSVVLQIFQLLCLADVNKVIKYERPGDCLTHNIKSFNGKILGPSLTTPDVSYCSNSLYIAEVSMRQGLISKKEQLVVINSLCVPAIIRLQRKGLTIQYCNIRTDLASKT